MHMNYSLLVILGLAIVFSAHAIPADNQPCKGTPTKSFCESTRSARYRGGKNCCVPHFDKSACDNKLSFWCDKIGGKRICEDCQIMTKRVAPQPPSPPDQKRYRTPAQMMHL